MEVSLAGKIIDISMGHLYHGYVSHNQSVWPRYGLTVHSSQGSFTSNSAYQRCHPAPAPEGSPSWALRIHQRAKDRRPGPGKISPARNRSRPPSEMSKTLGGYQERTRKNRDVSRDRTSSLVKFTRTTVGKSTFATSRISRTWKHGGTQPDTLW